MSLLMDALKKAELAKRQQAAGASAGTPSPAAVELELAPLESPPAQQKAPATPSLDVLEQDYLPAPATKSVEPPPATRTSQQRPPRPAPAPSVAETAEAQAAARNVFAAKEESEGNRFFLIGIVAFSVIAVIVIGIYFWLQLRPPASGLTAVAPPPPGQPRPTANPPAAPLAAAPAAAAAAKRESAPSDRPGAERPRLRTPAAPVTAPEAPIRITTARLRVDPALARGYDAFTAGSLADARAAYESVLKNEPKNADALLGMAAVSLRQGRSDLAEEYYVRALEADPKNGLAQAGLISLHSQTDPVQAESRLKTLLAAQPELPPLNFALGNLYARQGRWNEAQEAFFKAYTGDAENPDYLFNLAVSLDHLHQGKLAAQYYTQALAAARTHPANFDTAQAAARLRELH